MAIDEDPEATIMSRSTSNRRTGTGNSSLSRPPSPTLPSPNSTYNKPSAAAAASNRSCRFPEVEVQLVEWAKSIAKQGDYLSDSMLKERARVVAASMNITEQQFKASQGWLERFKVRAGISAGRFIEESRNLVPAPLDTSRPYTESAYPLPSPQEPLSSSSSSTGSFLDETDQDSYNAAHYARMRSDSAASATLPVQIPVSYAPAVEPSVATLGREATQMPTVGPAGHLQQQQHQYAQYPHTPITPHEYSSSGTEMQQPIGFAASYSAAQHGPQTVQHIGTPSSASFMRPQPASSGFHESSFAQAQQFHPGRGQPHLQPPPILRRATVSVPDARILQLQQQPQQHQQQSNQMVHCDARFSNGTLTTVDLQSAQNAFHLLTQFLQQEQHQQQPQIGPISSLLFQTLQELQQVLQISDGSFLLEQQQEPQQQQSAAYRPAAAHQEFDMYSGHKVAQHGEPTPVSVYSTGEAPPSGGFDASFATTHGLPHHFQPYHHHQNHQQSIDPSQPHSTFTLAS